MAEPLSALDAIIAAITQLTPTERRQLQRFLRVSGLLVPETTITDQARLRVAPALGVHHTSLRPPAANPPLTGPAARVGEPPAKAGAAEALATAPMSASVSRLGASAPLTGKVVVYEPTAPKTLDPHAMHPLPGQAPDQPIQIIFDGGSKGNPGLGYGSYALRWPGSQSQTVRLRFGNRVTNNEAEYDTLIAALEAVLKRLNEQGAAPATAKLDIRGDSLLVINQVQQKWKCNEPALRQRRDRAQALLKQFGRYALTHHDRANSVEVLGH